MANLFAEIDSDKARTRPHRLGYHEASALVKTWHRIASVKMNSEGSTGISVEDSGARKLHIWMPPNEGRGPCETCGKMPWESCVNQSTGRPMRHAHDGTVKAFISAEEMDKDVVVTLGAFGITLLVDGSIRVSRDGKGLIELSGDAV